jgi:segregation and condensation protein B
MNDDVIDDLESDEIGQPEVDDSVDQEPLPTQLPVDTAMLRRIVEGAVLATGQPMTVNKILELFDPLVAPTKEEVQAALEDIQAETKGRGYELKEVASGWRFQVCDDLAPWIGRLWDEKPQKYSRALLETLSLIAYRQPITRGDIEEIRGVAVSSHIMKTLLEREWVKVVGHRDVPGRPSLYATTRQFLDYFNLKSLEELPSLSEIRDLDEINPMLNLVEEGVGEKDTDAPIPDQTDLPSITELEAQAVTEEFVDGEAAFTDADIDIDDAGIEINQEKSQEN